MEPTTADAILVFGKTLATRPAVMDGLLRLSKTYKHSLADMHSVWLRTADKESPGEDQENAGSLLNAVSVSATAPKDLPSLKDVTALEKYYARQQEESLNAQIPKAQSFLKASVPIKTEQVQEDAVMFDKDSLDAFLTMGNRASLTTPRKVTLLQSAPAEPFSIGSRSAVKKESTPGAKHAAASPYTPFKKSSSASAATAALSGPESPWTPSQPQDLTSQFIMSREGHKTAAGPLEVFNDHVPGLPEGAIGKLTLNKRANISLLPGQQIKGYRYMHDKLADEGLNVDESIDAVAELIAAQELVRLQKEAAAKKKEGQPNQMSTNDEEEDEDDISPDSVLDEEKDGAQLIQRFMPPPNIPRQEEILTVGRICCDSVVEAARLNERSVVLETSRLIGNGTRIPLNLDKLILSGKAYSLFPGQIVGVRGNNPSGRLLNVSEFIYPPLAPVATTQVKRYLELYPSSKEDSKDPLVLMTGCGPFTLPDSLEFEPLEVFLKNVEKTMPDVLILMGPFIDASHPLIVDGLSAHDPRSLFKIKVMDRVKNLLQVLPSLQVILVPSTNDLISDWPLLPQPPLGAEVTDAETLKSTEALGLNLSRLLVLPNPVTFLLNEILITISNTDTLVELAGSESGRTEQGSTIKPDRLALFFRHLLQQRHVHPLFPSTHKIHYEHGSPFLMGVRPDLLIIPSLLKPSVKAVEGVLCLNPGTAVKGKVAGTYGRIVVHPLDLSLGMGDLDGDCGDEELEARIEPRTRVELSKL